jgi:hypothetical protein
LVTFCFALSFLFICFALLCFYARLLNFHIENFIGDLVSSYHLVLCLLSFAFWREGCKNEWSLACKCCL